MTSLILVMTICSLAINHDFRVTSASLERQHNLTSPLVMVRFIDEYSFEHSPTIAVPSNILDDKSLRNVTITYSSSNPSWARYGNLLLRPMYMDNAPPHFRLEYYIICGALYLMIAICVYHFTIGRYGLALAVYRRYFLIKRNA